MKACKLSNKRPKAHRRRAGGRAESLGNHRNCRRAPDPDRRELHRWGQAGWVWVRRAGVGLEVQGTDVPQAWGGCAGIAGRMEKSCDQCQVLCPHCNKWMSWAGFRTWRVPLRGRCLLEACAEQESGWGAPDCCCQSLLRSRRQSASEMRSFGQRTNPWKPWPDVATACGRCTSAEEVPAPLFSLTLPSAPLLCPENPKPYKHRRSAQTSCAPLAATPTRTSIAVMILLSIDRTHRDPTTSDT